MFTGLLCHLIVATSCFPRLDQANATAFFNSGPDQRAQPAILGFFGVKGSYFSEEGSDRTYKIKSETGDIIYRPYKENQIEAAGTVLAGMTPLILAVKVGGYRETLARLADGTFAVFDVTGCPDEQPLQKIHAF